MDYHVTSYIDEIDNIITTTSQKIRIIFLQSDYSNILELALNRKSGSSCLRRWLGVENYKDFRSAQLHHAARLFTSVYTPSAGFGVLENDNTYKKKYYTGSPDVITLTLGEMGVSPTVNYRTPEKQCLSLQIRRLPENTALDPEKCLDIQYKKREYIIGESDKMLLQIDSIKPPMLNYDSCKFFYLTNADALGMEALTKMIHAFLESKDYPNAKLVLTGTTRIIPDAFSGYIQLIRLSSPSQEDIENDLINMLDQEIGGSSEFTAAQIREYASALTGLSYMQLEALYAQLGNGRLHRELSDDKKTGKKGLQNLRNKIWEQRMVENQKDSTLNYQRIEENPGIVGVGGFMRWLNQNLKDLTNPEDARDYGITPPKGVILAGVPGTGKSQLAKQMTYRWWQENNNVIKIDFNIGNLSSSNYGESEARMLRFLDRISEQEPAILFVDEVEKTFYRSKNGEQEMHAVKKQQMGMFLGWLQEHKQNIFTFMTSNDIDILPPELIRSGRISERFFMFMPNYYELMSMLYVFLRKPAERGKFSKEFNKEIEEKCAVIQEYSKQYGSVSIENDQKLDANLKKAIMNSSLSQVLILLATNAAEQNRTPFLTGADMEELVKNTITQLRRKKTAGYCTGNDFEMEMLEICCKPEYTPYGQSNLAKLAKLYLACDYQDASADPLLPRYRFDAQKGKFKTTYDGYIEGREPDNAYDQYMQKILIREIEDAAQDAIWEKEHRKHQKEQQEFHNEQAAHIRAQWEEEAADKPARKKSEENAREIQKLQLEQLRTQKK